MRTFFLFALTLAGIVALTEDASAIGKRRRAEPCCPVAPTPCCGQPGMAYGVSAPGYYGPTNVTYNSGYGVYGADCCGQPGMAVTGYESRRGLFGRRNAGGTYAQNYYAPNYYPNSVYSNGGVYQSGYYSPTNPSNVVIPAGATID